MVSVDSTCHVFIFNGTHACVAPPYARPSGYKCERHGRARTCCTSRSQLSNSFPERTTQVTSGTMLSKRIFITIAVVVAAVCLAEALEEGPHNMADTLRMLQELDRIYTQAARPRFGKRSEAISNWAKDLEKPDIPAWLAYARR
ncbi:jg6985 [Pararge aegeria aegeria]|uniref:Jg6985 protein n=1 Tax=Pararge aegeria aegeria TaxID=348720 RepID=A0A8S4SF51_9NEOP|nr:jg6985 [Pararge aegeria aegeria]